VDKPKIKLKSDEDYKKPWGLWNGKIKLGVA
jgi:hypothetical protein